MEVRVEKFYRTYLVQPFALLWLQLPICRLQVVRQLLSTPGPKDHRTHCRLAEQVEKRRLRDARTVRLGNIIKHIDDVEGLLAARDQQLVPIGQMATDIRGIAIAPVLAG